MKTAASFSLRCVLIAASFFGACVSMFAQTPPAPVYRMEVTAIVTDGAAPQDTFFQGEKGVETPLTIFGFSRGPVASYAGPARLLLWRRGIAGAKSPVAAIDLREGMQRALLILKPNPRAEEPRQPSHLGVAVEDSPRHSPPGSARFINLIGQSAVADMDGRKVDVPAGASPSYPLVTDPAKIIEPLLKVAAPHRGEYRMIYQNRLKLGGGERLTIFLLPGRGEGGLAQVRVSKDSIPLVPAPVLK